jgi:hypothetical protein
VTDYERGFAAGVEACIAYFDAGRELGITKPAVMDALRALSPAPTAPQGEKESE